MSGLPGENYKKISFFLVIALCIFRVIALWTAKIYVKDVSKTITASSLRFGQLIEVGE